MTIDDVDHCLNRTFARDGHTRWVLQMDRLEDGATRIMYRDGWGGLHWTTWELFSRWLADAKEVRK